MATARLWGNANRDLLTSRTKAQGLEKGLDAAELVALDLERCPIQCAAAATMVLDLSQQGGEIISFRRESPHDGNHLALFSLFYSEPGYLLCRSEPKWFWLRARAFFFQFITDWAMRGTVERGA